MKTCQFFFFTIVVGATIWRGELSAQNALQLANIRLLTNHEVGLTLNVSNAASYRLEVASQLPAWENLVTFSPSTTTALQYTDSAAPYLSERFYRAEQLQGTNLFSGDHLGTTNGDVIMQPRYHASFVMSWNGLMIYVDPVDPATFTGLAKADLILVTHSHGDHFSTAKIEAVRSTNTVIIAPQDVYNQLTAPQKLLTLVLRYGDRTNALGMTIEAVPAYNSYHPRNFGNGYMVTIGGKRIYISGDTGNVPEIHQLTNVDVAFLCMNQPFTLTVDDATNVVSAILPKAVYPYHYRDQSGATANAANFKQRLAHDLGIEVRLRKWY